MFTLCSSRDDLSPAMARSLYGDRGSQFVDRFGWDLCVTPEGMEIDAYDDDACTHVIVAEGERHLGSCRVRPVEAGTMLEEHFADAFPQAGAFLAMQGGRFYELTRFCRDPGLSVEASRDVLRHLAVALDRFRDSDDVTGFVAVVFAPVTRFLQRIGVRFVRLGVSRIDGRAAHLICVTQATEAQRLLPLYDRLVAAPPAPPCRAMPRAEPERPLALA